LIHGISGVLPKMSLNGLDSTQASSLSLARIFVDNDKIKRNFVLVIIAKYYEDKSSFWDRA
jgi:hypothetical protein